MGKHRKHDGATDKKDKAKVLGGEKHEKKLSQLTKKSKLTFSPRPDWHAAPLPEIVTGNLSSNIPQFIIDKVQQHANDLLEKETSEYASTHLQSSSSHKFLSTIMSSGTWGDKVSALTLMIQESPLHTIKPLENLLGLAGKRSRTQALMALGALKDLMGQGSLLPADRKLRYFAKQPGLMAALQGIKKSWTSSEALPNGIKDVHLVYWAYEDRLKHIFFDMLRVLETWCSDEVEHSRLRTVTYIWELLKEKPEQEENLLRLIVNKLGDTSKKVASRASHLLLQLEVTHPSMKSIIISAIESDILLRPGPSSSAKYYAIITLNQTVLQHGAPEVASKLLGVYFGMFVTILKRTHPDDKRTPNAEQQEKKRKRQSAPENVPAKQEIDDKIVAQILTGINRAFHYSKVDNATFEKHLDTLFRITHSANFNTSVQALLLIQQISAELHISTDRFMRTLYESLLDPRLAASSKQTMYLNLLYRSLKSDLSIRRVKAFVKRLLQVLSLHDPPFICAVLFLVHELETMFPSLKAMLEQAEVHEEDLEEKFVDVPEQADDKATVPETSPRDPKLVYDARKRDPEHSNADRTCLWELPPWANHYHPSVAIFANTLLTSSPSPPKPDPTTHTLSHFLDRFVYRNAKTRGDGTRGISLMQPALGNTKALDVLVTKSTHDDISSLQPVNSEAFWQQRSELVAPDEVFFHKYFGAVAPKRQAKSNTKTTATGDVDSEADEDEIWKALVGSRPEIEGGSGDEFDDDGDIDLDMDDDDDDEDDGDKDPDFDMDGEDGGFDDVDIEGGFLDSNNDGDDFDVDEQDMDDGGVEFNLESDEGEALFSDEESDAANDEGDAPHKALVSNAIMSKSKDGRKKRKLKNLPTFASVEDYAKLLDQDDDPDGGY